MGEPSGGLETVGQRLRRLRLERGLSQRALAGRGVSYAYISRIESGNRHPSLKAVRELARRLGVSVEELDTGRRVSPAEERELQVTDAELQLRLGDDLVATEETFRVLAADEEAEPEITARAFAGLGLIALSRGEGEEAAGLLERAIGAGHLPAYVRPDVYEELARAYSYLESPAKAVQLLEGALEEVRAHASADVTTQVRLMATLATACSEANDARRAKKLLHEAEEHLGAVASPQAKVRICGALARLAWWEAQESDTAFSYAREVIAIYRSTEDTRGLARAYLFYGQLLNLEREWQEAEWNLERADAMLAAIDVDDRTCGVLRAEQAKCAAWGGRGDQALRLANEAEALFGDEPLERGLKWHAYAAAHAARNDPKKAQPFYRRALDFLLEHRQWREATMVAREWADLCRSIGENDKALDLLERASIHSDRLPSPSAPLAHSKTG
jgi:transcriptional regulator with XRE-family HTH domain